MSAAYKGQSILVLSKISLKSLYLARLRRYKQFRFFNFSENSKWPQFLERGKFFRNSSISHSLGDTANFKFLHFLRKFENSNGRLFWKEENFFEIALSRIV